MKRGLNVRYLLLISLVAALGGFLFGYDTAVVSGAIGFLKAHFNLSAELTGWAASSVLVGCMFGAMIGGPLGDRIGRKPGLFLCALLFGVSAVVSALPHSLGLFAWARFAGGLAIGAASILSPMYIAEVSPGAVRGRLVALYQLAIVVGILAVFFVNLQIQRLGDEAWNVDQGWRWMFGSLVLPSALFGGLLALVPESPRWLMKAGREEAARKVLEAVGGAEEAAREIGEIRAVLRQEEGKWSELLTTYRKPLVIGSLLAVAQQFSGINTVMYYAPEIFKAAGAARDAAFAQTVTVGVVNVVFTLVAVGFVDRAGRRPLLITGTAVQALSLFLVGALFGGGGPGWVLVGGVLLFVAAFAAAMGPVGWVVISEIFPTKLRGRAMAVSIFVLWLSCFVVSQTFPVLLEALGPSKTFWLYSGFSLLSLLFVFFFVPETKGRTLEEIEESWKK